MITAITLCVIFFALFVYSRLFREITYSIYSAFLIVLTLVLSFRFNFDFYEISKLELFGIGAFVYLVLIRAKSYDISGYSPWVSVFYDLVWTGRLLFYVTIGSAIAFTLDAWLFGNRVIATLDLSYLTDTLIASYLIIYYLVSLLVKRIYEEVLENIDHEEYASIIAEADTHSEETPQASEKPNNNDSTSTTPTQHTNKDHTSKSDSDSFEIEMEKSS